MSEMYNLMDDAPYVVNATHSIARGEKGSLSNFYKVINISMKR